MNNKKNNFLKYIHTPVSKESVVVLYDANNIKFEKCELYGDFVQSLLSLAFDTYLGDDITNLEQQKNHFKWCWNKNVSNFAKEGVIFESNKLYEYFLEFMLEVYYTSVDKKKTENMDKNLLKLWDDVFNYNNTKTNHDVDTLIEIYQIMEKSLKNA